MRVLTFLILTLFTFQTFDFVPRKGAQNPKTCCGRIVCQCKHDKGAFCPIRHGMPEKNLVPAQNMSHKHCHMKIKSSEVPAKGLGFSKAPCAGEVPKTELPHYSKDFLSDFSHRDVILPQADDVNRDFQRIKIPLLASGIEHPPRLY